MTRKRQINREALREAADWLYDACWLYEDEDLDPDNSIAVIKRAYTSSDCDDFAWMLNLMTSWPVVRATWQISDWGFGHHSLVRAPDGRLLDVRGLTDEATAAKRCCRRKDIEVKFTEVPAKPLNDYDGFDDDGFEPDMQRLAAIVRNLPYAPFNTPDFQQLSLRPLAGVDRPQPQSDDGGSGHDGAGIPDYPPEASAPTGASGVRAEDVVYYCLTHPEGAWLLSALALGNALIETECGLSWRDPSPHELVKAALDALIAEAWVRESKADRPGQKAARAWVITEAGQEAARLASSGTIGHFVGDAHGQRS